MNYFEQQQLAKIRVREARRTGSRVRLAKLAPSRFRAWHWRAFAEWFLGGLVFLGLIAWFLLAKAARRVTAPIRAKTARADMLALVDEFQQTGVQKTSSGGLL